LILKKNAWLCSRKGYTKAQLSGSNHAFKEEQ
jgi:hypothetical protein